MPEDELQIQANFLEDKISYFIYTKYGMRGYYFVYITLYLLLVLASYYEGTLFHIDIETTKDVITIPLIKDYAQIFAQFFFIIIGYLVYIFFNDICKYFTQLWENKLFVNTDIIDYQNHIKKYANRANNQKNTIFSGIFFLTLLIVWIIFEKPFTGVVFSYSRQFPLAASVIILGGIVWSFLFGIFIWKIYVLIELIQSFFNYSNKKIQLTYINPTNIDILNPMGQLSFRISQLSLFFIYIPISNLMLGFYWNVNLSSFFVFRGIGNLILFILIYFFILLYPLISTHRFMKTQKKLQLEEVSKFYQDNYNNLLDKISDKNIDSYDKELINTIGFQNLYKDIKNMNVWPFDTGIIRNIIVMVIIPIFVFFIQIYFMSLI